MEKRTPLSITGMGVVSAAGVGLTETSAVLFGEGRLPASRLDPEQAHYFKLRAEPEWFFRYDLSRRQVPNLFALMAVDEALANAGLDRHSLKNLRVGVCLGSTVGGTNYHEEFNNAYFRGELPPAGSLFDYFTTNSAQFVSRHYGCRGPVQMISNACTSGADAIGTAAHWLDADLCDLVICGGTEAVHVKMYYGFKSLMLCSPLPCQPFDRARRGLTLGEGAGILILEKARTPRATKVRLLGFGMGSDALHPTSPHPEARGLDLAARAAMTQAECSLAEISFINAHGTATPHNDLAEGRWIRQHAPTARLVATKGYTGHTLGAAGAVEAVFTALSLARGKLPMSRGFTNIDPEIGLSPTTQVETGDFSRALSFSLGFGGANTALCFGSTR